MEILLNGERIPAQTCEEEVRRALRENPGLDQAEAESRAAEILIAQGLLRQNAFNSGIGVTREEVDAVYGRIVAAYGGEALFYTQLGLSKKQHEKRIKREVQERLRVDRLVADLTRDLPPPSEEAVEAYCREHADSMVHPPRVHASQIVRRAEGDDQAAVYREMVALRARLLEGADFAQAAREHSGCDDRGGDLGTFPPGRMAGQFDVVVFSMRPGEISPVFLTDFGFHLVKVWESEPERPMTREEALEQARTRLADEARNRHVADWLTAKRQHAVIDIRP